MILSVCVTTYNCSQYFSDLVSGLEQNWIDDEMELIVCDDCSRDKPDFSLFKKFKHFKLIEMSENMGNVFAKNRALKEAKAKYVTCHDGDDWSLAGRFIKQISFLEKNPEIYAVGCSSLLTDNSGRAYRRNFFPRSTENIKKTISKDSGVPLCPATLVWRNEGAYFYRSFFNNIGAEDADLIMRMLSSGKNITVINEAIYCYRKLAQSVSHSVKKTYSTEIAYFLYQQRLEGKKDSLEREAFEEVELYVESLKKHSSDEDLGSIEIANTLIDDYNCRGKKEFFYKFISLFKKHFLRIAFFIALIRFSKMLVLKNLYYRFKFPASQ